MRFDIEIQRIALQLDALDLAADGLGQLTVSSS